MGEESTGSRRKGFEKVILRQWVVAAKDQHGSSSVCLTCRGALGLGDQCSHGRIRIQPVSEHMGWRQVKGSR